MLKKDKVQYDIENAPHLSDASKRFLITRLDTILDTSIAIDVYRLKLKTFIDDAYATLPDAYLATTYMLNVVKILGRGISADGNRS